MVTNTLERDNQATDQWSVRLNTYIEVKGKHFEQLMRCSIN